MTSLIDAPRGADLLLSYLFPAGTDLGGHVAAFTVYGEKNGTVLLAVGMTANGNGSSLAVNGNLLQLTVRGADIDALPVNADDATTPALLWFDLVVTTPSPDVCKLYGGLMRVLPFGAATAPQGEVIEVALAGQAVTVEVAQSGFDTAVLSLAEGYAATAGAGAEAAAIQAGAAAVDAAAAASAASAAASSATGASASATAAAGSAASAAGSAASAGSSASAAAGSAGAASASATAAAGSATAAAGSAAQLGMAVPIPGYDRSGYVAGVIDSADNILWAVTPAGTLILANGGDIASTVATNSTSIAVNTTALAQVGPSTDFVRNTNYIAGMVDAADNIIWAVTSAGAFVAGDAGGLAARFAANEGNIAANTANITALAPISGYDRSGFVAGEIDAADNILWAVDGGGNFYTSSGPVGATVTSQPEGRGAKLRRLMTLARLNNPLTNPLAIGNSPRVASANVTAGQQISNGGKVYEITTGGTLSSGGGTTSRGYGISDGTAVLDYVGMQTAPVVTNLTSVPMQLTQNIPASPTSSILRFGGGVTENWPGKTGGVGSWCVNCGVLTGVGNEGHGNFLVGDATNYGKDISGHFMELKTDSSMVCFAVDQSSSIGVNILVSDESGLVQQGFRAFNLLPFAPSVGASGKAYIVVDFSSQATSTNFPLNTRMRRIRIVTGGLAFYGAYILPQATAVPIGTANRATLLQFGDSWTLAGTGLPPQLAYGNRFGPAEVLGWHTGFDNVIASGAGSTGLVRGPSGNYCPRNFQQRAADLCSLIPEPDLITTLGSVNDTVDAVAMEAGAANFIANIRNAGWKNVPIVMYGMDYSSYTDVAHNSNAITQENAIAAGVTASGDARAYFVPVQTTASPYIQGTGTVAAPNGTGNADQYINSASHLEVETGPIYYGGRMAQDLMPIIQNATWVN